MISELRDRCFKKAEPSEGFTLQYIYFTVACTCMWIIINNC